MENGWNFTPILIPLIALFVGWAIGFFDSNMRSSKKIKQAEESARVAIEATERKLAEAETKLSSATGTPIMNDDLGLMRIKNENGLLTLDLDGVRVNPSALTVDQRKRLIEMLNTMRPWLEGKPVPTPMPLTPPQPKPSPAPVPVVPPPPQQTSKPQKSETKKKGEEPEAAPTSIVGQINLILQARIVNTPLVAKGVSLMESVTGGVNVYVGVKRYDAIDDVPDEDVKAAIRAAIAEWEKKYTPGL
jgi:hypothetical protein